MPPEQWVNGFSSELSRLVGAAGGQAGREPGAGPPGGGAHPAPARAYQEREKFLSCLPPGYMEETAPADAAQDWFAIAVRLPDEPGDLGLLMVTPCRNGAPGDFRLRRIGRYRVELSSLLPVLESFGLAAVEAVPWHFAPGAEGQDTYLDDVGLRVGTNTLGPATEAAGFAPRLVEAVKAVLGGHAEANILNRLVVGAGLGWREVNLLSAYRAYRQVVGGLRAAEKATSMAEALVAFPAAAVAAVELFRSRLGRPGVAGDDEGARSRLATALAEVPD
ncbi:MAG: hypothetical protein ACRDZX_09150, partial [Acidimicrobiales bacterium]